MNLLYISIFGVLGVLSRYSIDLYLSNKEYLFPYPTLLVNLIGSILAGFLYTVALEKTASSTIYIPLIIGFCGGLTTFSSLTLQSFNMIQQGHLFRPFIYLTGSCGIGVICVFIGNKIAKNIILS